MVLLPIAFGLAILALLMILRRERYQRALGHAAPRPLFVTLVLAAFAALAVVYVTVYVVSALTA
jgi:hypothetical protein